MAETFTFDLGSERNVKIYEHNTNVEETIIDVACSTMTNQRKKVSPCPCLDAHPVRFYRNYRRESGGCEERQRR